MFQNAKILQQIPWQFPDTFNRKVKKSTMTITTAILHDSKCILVQPYITINTALQLPLKGLRTCQVLSELVLFFLKLCLACLMIRQLLPDLFNFCLSFQKHILFTEGSNKQIFCTELCTYFTPAQQCSAEEHSAGKENALRAEVSKQETVGAAQGSTDLEGPVKGKRWLQGSQS